MENRQYIAIDLKSFYASVECVERGLDPLDACLVVADESRTEKTICLAVSPALKSFGTGGRPRLFEVVEKVRSANAGRRAAVGGALRGKSASARVLARDPFVAIDYVVASPRMALYMEYSRRIYDIYMRFVSAEDVHVYSVDEVFIDATAYLKTYGLTAHQLAMKMIRAVLAETGITATAGIGTNLYLSKIAMDIVAKHMPADKDGVRIAELDEQTYRRSLWAHTPITDFWRVGRGIAAKLAAHGIYTMGDVARASLEREALLYRLMGVSAELLIDHAWGWEPVTIADIKAYRPATHSLSSGQVLQCPYPFDKARVVAMEMTDALALELTDKRLVTTQIVLEVGYDVESVSGGYNGPVDVDRYGRRVPRHAHGTGNLSGYTSLSSELVAKVAEVFDRIVDRELTVRRLNVTVCKLSDSSAHPAYEGRQLDIFADSESDDLAAEREREERRQQAMLKIRKQFGMNAILRGTNFMEGATQRERNKQIGGHKA